jgi:hypothetical protein
MVIDTACPVVAILDSAGMAPDLYTCYLSPAELTEASVIGNERRRAEWVAGRLAAKYVFLHRERFGAFAGASLLTARNLTSIELDAFFRETYRSVAVTKDKSPGGGPARVGWQSESESLKVAISHASGLACAFIGAESVYSLDLELTSPRIPGFYLQNFTPGERNWTDSSARLFNLSSDWLYTLLWSAKECLLKTPRFAGLSLWNMPSLEINILSGIERLANINQPGGLSGTFQFLQAEATSPAPLTMPDSRTSFQLAVSGTADLILTALTRLD